MELSSSGKHFEDVKESLKIKRYFSSSKHFPYCIANLVMLREVAAIAKGRLACSHCIRVYGEAVKSVTTRVSDSQISPVDAILHGGSEIIYKTLSKYLMISSIEL